MENRYPSIAYSITVRAEYPNRVGMLGQVTSAIGEVGGDIGAIDTVSSSRQVMVRDITINARDPEHGQELARRIRDIPQRPAPQHFGPHLPAAPGGEDRGPQQDARENAQRHVHGLHPRRGTGQHGHLRRPPPQCGP